MPEWIEAALFIAGYFAVIRWVLPRFGVYT